MRKRNKQIIKTNDVTDFTWFTNNYENRTPNGNNIRASIHL